MIRHKFSAILVCMLISALATKANAQLEFEFVQEGSNDILALLFLIDLPVNDAAMVSGLALTESGNSIYGIGTQELSPFLLEGTIADDGDGGLGNDNAAVATILTVLEDTTMLQFQENFPILNLSYSTAIADQGLDSLNIVGVYDDGSLNGEFFGGTSIGQWRAVAVPEPIGFLTGVFMTFALGFVGRRSRSVVSQQF